MPYPTEIDSFLNPNGTTLLSTGHSLDHRELGSAAVAIQTVLGTTNGTSVLRNFSAGDFPARISASNVLQQALTGTINNSIVGTSAITGGTINNVVVGTPLITGGTLNNSVVGTPNVTGGTLNTVKKLTPLVGTLTDSPGGTISINMNDAPIFELNLGTTAGDRTLAAPTNPVDGQLLTVRIKQNAGNTGTILFNAIYRHSSDIGTPTLGTASTFNYWGWRYNNTDTKFDFVGQSNNIS